MRVLVVGSGGREHALCWGLKKSPQLTALFCAPGNPGIAAMATCLPIAADDIDGLVGLLAPHKIDFVVIGPEVPLSMGLADRVRASGVLCFGPSQAAAEIESSKGFMKDLVAAAGVPTADYQRFTDVEAAKAYIRAKGVPIVVKADGLAAGKGVTVAQTLDEALRAVDEAMVHDVFGSAGSSVVIEEFMVGEEASFFALCDGTHAIPFTAAQDHKAVFDGDKGPNTGGMGAYSPAPKVDARMTETVMNTIVIPTLDQLRAMGRPFVGVLFAGLMLTATGPRLIEFNARFGDPETEVMIPRLKTDLLGVLHAAATGNLAGKVLDWHHLHALTVVMAAKGYPGAYANGTMIQGVEQRSDTAIVFHAGTSRRDDGALVANGGRVLAVTAWADDLKTAQKQAYATVDNVVWDDGFCRRDIGWRALG